jgi:Zn-finger nucleic acid-binding protein
MTQRKCPKCLASMSLWSSGDVELDHCESCRGLWFDADELPRHLANIAGGTGIDLPESGCATRFRCPACVNIQLFGAVLHGIPIECCAHCRGVFLDLGEIHELLGKLNRPERAHDPKSSLSRFEDFALGLFVGMRQGDSKAGRA